MKDQGLIDHLYFTLDSVPNLNFQNLTHHQAGPEWKGFTGFVTKEMLAKTMPKPSESTYIFTCGPPPMMGMLSK